MNMSANQAKYPLQKCDRLSNKSPVFIIRTDQTVSEIKHPTLNTIDGGCGERIANTVEKSLQLSKSWKEHGFSHDLCVMNEKIYIKSRTDLSEVSVVVRGHGASWRHDLVPLVAADVDALSQPAVLLQEGDGGARCWSLVQHRLKQVQKICTRDFQILINDCVM